MKALPDWIDCSERINHGAGASPLEIFIYNNEPAGEEQKEWRQQLADTLNYFLREEQYYVI